MKLNKDLIYLDLLLHCPTPIISRLKLFLFRFIHKFSSFTHFIVKPTLPSLYDASISINSNIREAVFDTRRLQNTEGLSRNCRLALVCRVFCVTAGDTQNSDITHSHSLMMAAVAAASDISL